MRKKLITLRSKINDFYFNHFQKNLIFNKISLAPTYYKKLNIKEIVELEEKARLDSTEILWNSTTRKPSEKTNSSEISKNRELSIYFISKNKIKFFKESKAFDSNLSTDSGNLRFSIIKNLILRNVNLSSSDYLLDIGCSTGGLINGMQFYGSHNSLGIDINLDNCLSYANRFAGPKTFFKEMTLQDLIKIKPTTPFKLTLFTYQIHGGSRWLRDVPLQNKFFRWIYDNSEYFITNSNFMTEGLCGKNFFKEIDKGVGSFIKEHPLVLLKPIKFTNGN